MLYYDWLALKNSDILPDGQTDCWLRDLSSPRKPKEIRDRWIYEKNKREKFQVVNVSMPYVLQRGFVCLPMNLRSVARGRPALVFI